MEVVLENTRGRAHARSTGGGHGGDAPPDDANEILCRLGTRLADTGYEVHRTPFGYFNEWDLRVHGESLAKVWKQI